MSEVVIGIDHDTVCAGVVGTAIRHSASCAGRRAAARCGAGRHNECCAKLQYQPQQRRPYKWSIYILPRSQFYKKQDKLAFSTSCTAVRPHRRLRNDAWRRDSTASDVTIGMWQSTGHEPRAQRQTLVFTPKVDWPCNLQVMICRWMNDNTKICTSDAMNLEEITHL